MTDLMQDYDNLRNLPNTTCTAIQLAFNDAQNKLLATNNNVVEDNIVYKTEDIEESNSK